jgi:AcrR family transcriptional regulator
MMRADEMPQPAGTEPSPPSPEPRAPVQKRTAGRRERRRAEVRERLFQAALALFNERGFQATTVKDITEAADVGKGTFFNYFRSKEHFWVAYYEQQKRNFDQAQRAVDEGAEPVRQTIKKLMWRMSEKTTPALVRSFLQAVFSNQTVASIVMPQLFLNRQRFEAMLAIGQRRGEVRRDKSPAELARVLHEVGFGTALFWAFRSDIPLDSLLDANLDLLLNSDPRPTDAGVKRRQTTLGRTNGSVQRPHAAVHARNRRRLSRKR